MSIGRSIPFVIDPLSVLLLAEESGLTRGKSLFQEDSQFHGGHQGGRERVIDLLRGVELQDFIEAGLIESGVSRLMPTDAHLRACWRYIANATSALEASELAIAKLRAQVPKALTDGKG